MSLIDSKARKKIRELNDAFRTTFAGGQVNLTAGVAGYPADIKVKIMMAVRAFSDFSEGNDPHGEHDFGSFELFAQKFFWKIDYFDTDLRFGSDDPSDPGKTKRVLTIMLAEEY